MNQQMVEGTTSTAAGHGQYYYINQGMTAQGPGGLGIVVGQNVNGIQGIHNNQIRGGQQEMLGDLKRVPSTQTYIPGPSSFYGKANTSQTNTHLNVSHFKNDFDGEISSQNQPVQSQANFPHNRYHQYHMSYDQFTLQQKNQLGLNPMYFHQNIQPQLNQQANRLSTLVSGASFQTIPEVQLNHRINHSHGGGPVQQRNFLQQSHYFDRPFSVDTHNEQRSRSNSPHHNKTLSYLNMGSANSSVDFSSTPMQQHSHPLFQTQMTSNYNTQRSSLQVHQEESRESSLGTSDINSNKDKVKNDLNLDNNDDAEGLGFHSERIEDLLEDYNEDNNTNLKSVEELSIKTTVVHSHQLSKGSMSHLIPGSFISSQQLSHLPNLNQLSPYSRGEDYEDQLLYLQQHQNALAQQNQVYLQNIHLYQNYIAAGGNTPVGHQNLMNTQQHYKALSEDFATQNFKNQLIGGSPYFFQDAHGQNIPLRLNQQQQQQRIQQFVPQTVLQQQHQQQQILDSNFTHLATSQRNLQKN